MKARVEQSLTIGWQAERFARTKDIKDPAHWLRPAKSKNRDAGAGELRAMFARMAKRQETEDGTR
ncbi:hypothetical protein [Alteriqipengyuania lutimaris]|uniref:hypothetical protein n=1 Tax=Alteriqipengyuania lutimaris TaxID=1538146 RepID=UPI0015F1B231|nr:hypothetical protein [Alteriqipengyuania lutimaris]MBB3034058.1 hypothetical protein [Alteriqipengyuania lutimaris]